MDLVCLKLAIQTEDGLTWLAISTQPSVAAQVLSEYGYDTAAFGKWHNTPIDNLFKSGPFDQYPTGPLVDDWSA